MYKEHDYRVVVGIDFGTTYSGFAYAHKKNPEDITVHVNWQEYYGRFKTPTVLSYDDEYKSVTSWGFPALAKRPGRKKKNANRKPIELFKLYLGKMENKPLLPKGFDYKKAITDYLRELGKVIKQTLDNQWKVDFYTQVLIVLTIPAEFDDSAMVTIRECAFNAGILNNKYSRNLKFTTEPEAAAVHCMKSLKEHNLSVGSTFMVVDCGGGTVDLTTRKLLEDERLSEITERTGDFCGGSFVDHEFLRFLERRVGSTAIKLVKENHYSQLQFMIQEFCRMVKMKFTGVQSEFETFELELDELCPALQQYCKGEYLERMEDMQWNINLKFKDVQAMFDPAIDRIIELTHLQLISNNSCSALFLVGGFSESKYLRTRIKQTFGSRVPLIASPPQPVTAIVKGAVQFGLREEIVFDRVLKWTYGTDVTRKWRTGDPINERREDGRVIVFERLAERGKQIVVNEKVNRKFYPYQADQTTMGLDIYVTPHGDARFLSERHLKRLRKWSANLPSYGDRSILFTMIFGQVEIDVVAISPGSGEVFETKVELDL